MSSDPNHGGWAPRSARDVDAERTIAFDVPDPTPRAEQTLAFDTSEAERTQVLPSVPAPAPAELTAVPPPSVGPVHVPAPEAAADRRIDPRGTVDWDLQVARLNNRPSTDVGLLLLRLFSLPLVLHGFSHIMDFFGFAASIASHPVAGAAPELVSGLIIAGQLVLPLLLAAGFGTRLAAAAQTLLMAGVYALGLLGDMTVLDPTTRTLNAEGVLAYAAIALVLVLTGPGRLSLDHAITAASRERRVEKRVAKRLGA